MKKDFLIYIVLAGVAVIIFFILSIYFLNEEPTKIVKGVDSEQIIQIEYDNIKTHLKKLASEEYGGRRAGTSGEAEAALYLAQELKKIGLKPLGEENSYFQSFSIPDAELLQNGNRAVFRQKDSGSFIADNVLGVIESKKRPQQYIMLSAHFDHLGIWKNKLYPGANDNASGVSVLLEIARVLSLKEDIPSSVIFAFWSGEEMGLLGSNYYLRHPTVDLLDIKMVINLDSIGNGKNNEFIVWTDKESQIITDFIKRFSQTSSIKMVLESSKNHSSDHKTFNNYGIDGITILSKNWLEENHTPFDDPWSINYDKILLLGEWLIDIITGKDYQDLFISSGG